MQELTGKFDFGNIKEKYHQLKVSCFMNNRNTRSSSVLVGFEGSYPSKSSKTSFWLVRKITSTENFGKLTQLYSTVES